MSIKCHKCGQDMAWENDFDYDNWNDEGVEGIISFWSCPPCNIQYEITEIFEKSVDIEE